jgi:predicted transcriptional regulator
MSNLARANLEEYVNPETGEVSYGYAATKLIKRKGREFIKSYMEEEVMIDYQKLKYASDFLLIKWLEYSASFGQNTITSNSEIRKEMCEYARLNPTNISRALGRIRDAGLIKFNRNSIMINPNYAFRGEEKDFDKAVIKYNNFK